MKKILTTFAAFAFVLAMNAQVEKNVIFRVATGNISYTEPVHKKETVGSVLGSLLTAAAGSNTQNHPEFADEVRTAIVGGVGAARRLNVIDGLFQPGEIGENESAMYIDGNIASITTTSQTKETTDSKGKKHTTIQYRANINVAVNLKDAKSDAIIRTFNFNSGDYSYSWIESPQKAIGNAISHIKSRLTSALNSMYPLYAQIIEGNSVKKDKQKEVYIDLGGKDGVYNGMHFYVYSVKTIAGKEAKTEIGRIKITEVQGDDVSLCKVTKGGADIKTSIDAGAKLLIMSKD